MKIIKFFLLITVFNSCFEQKTNIEEKDLIPIWSQNTDLVGVPSTAPLIIDNELVVYSGEISLTALRIDDGEVIWRGAIDEKNSIQSNQLLYDGEKIVSNHIHDVIAWDKRTGEKVFFKGKSDGISVFKIGKNSITDEGYAFVGDTLDLYVLNKIGDIIYTKDIELSTAGVGYVNGKLFLGQRKTINGALTIGRIIALDAQSGDSLWGFETNNGGFSWIPPIIEEGVVYAGTYLGNPSRVFALDAENGEMIWERPGFSTYQMITNEHRIYVNTQGSLQAIEKSNGEIAWSVTFESSGTANIVYLEGYVYHVRNSELVIVQDSTGKVVHREPVPDGTFFWHVAASSDKIFAQTSRQLIAYQPWHLRN